MSQRVGRIGFVVAMVTVVAFGSYGSWSSRNAHALEFEEKLRSWQVRDYFEVVQAESPEWLGFSQVATLRLQPGKSWRDLALGLKRRNPETFRTFSEKEIVVQMGDFGIFLERKGELIAATATLN